MRDKGLSEQREPLGSRTRTLDALGFVAKGASSLVVLIGAVALVGWAADVEVLKSLRSGVPMNPLAAILFLLTGVALWLLTLETRGPRERLAARIFGLLVASCGIFIVLSYLLHWEPGVDRMLFRGKLDIPGTFANRIPPNSALNFLLAGLALLLLDWEPAQGFRPAQMLILSVGLISLLALIGYGYHVLLLSGVGAQIPMALNTALAFAVLSLGILCARPTQGIMALVVSESAGGATLRRLLPAVILIPALLGAFRLWGEEKGYFDANFGVATFAVSSMVLFGALIWWNAQSLYRADQERRRMERRLAVQYTAARALAESCALKEAVPKILKEICETLGWQMGAMWELDQRANTLNCVELWRVPDSRLDEFIAMTRQASFPPKIGLPGRVWASGEPAWIPDVTLDTNFPRGPLALKANLHGAFGFPIRHGGELLGVFEFFSREIQQPDDAFLQMIGAVGNQIGQFIERARMEAALRDSEALYHSLVETLPINILRKDLKGRITFGNRRYCETMGKPLSELMGRTDYDLFPKELAEKYVADDRKVLESREVFEDVEQHQRPTGEQVFMHVLKAPVLDASGSALGTQVIFWDVTARRRAEEALAQTAADLSRSNRELELFAYVASHDLQEPLRMIASYTQLLERRYKDKLDADANEFIRFAVDGAVRMQRLINDLLAYSRLGTKVKTFEPTDCEKVLSAALNNLQIAVQETGATITHDPLPTVPGDSVQLIQLFQNLIGNALKFRGARAPVIHVGARPEAGEWVFFVRDNGIGIEPKYFERIFVIFQRLHTREEYPGTGIGLAVCKKIVERHGGRIWVESEPGHGTTFFFTLAAAPGKSG